MNFIDAIILGLIQGLTEFLPVSSSGHLFLIDKLGIIQTDVSLFYNIMLHLGSLFAVIIVFWKEVKYVISNPLSDITKYIVLASIPTVIIVGILRLFFKSTLEGSLLPFGFAVTTVMLICTKIIKPKEEALGTRSSLIIGIAQGFAAIPGISRSGSTIATAQILGVNREEAAKFSFLISIPIIIGSTLFESLSLTGGSLQINMLPVILGVFAAFLSGLLALKILINVIKKAKLHYFAIYTFALTIFSFFVMFNG